MKSVNLYIDTELWKKAKVQAVQEGIPLRELVDKALREYLETQKERCH